MNYLDRIRHQLSNGQSLEALRDSGRLFLLGRAYVHEQSDKNQPEVEDAHYPHDYREVLADPRGLPGGVHVRHLGREIGSEDSPAVHWERGYQVESRQESIVDGEDPQHDCHSIEYHRAPVQSPE